MAGYRIEPEGTHVLEIDESELASAESLHAEIARTLSFPAYYGGNLAALSDCLEDLDEPTCIAVRRAPMANRRPWFDGFCRVIERASNENPRLRFEELATALPETTLDDILVRLESIDARLDALQAQPAAAPAPAAPAAAPVGAAARETCRNLASGSDGDRFKCGSCGCRVSDYLEETRQLIDGLRYCPLCGREVTNPEGSNALGWVGELI